MALLINFVVFQFGWFACVLGGAYGRPLLGTLVALALIGLHLWRVARPGRELVLVLIAALMGLVFDSLLVMSGLLRFPSGTLVEGMAPYWIIAMWMMFATTLNITFRWLKGRAALAALLGAVAGPLAYYAGAELGGVDFLRPAPGLAALAVVWGVAMPLLMVLSDRFDGTAQTTRETVLPAGSATAEKPE